MRLLHSLSQGELSLLPEPRKHCNKCDTDRPIDEFYRDRSKRDGRRTTCIHCDRKQQAGRKRRQCPYQWTPARAEAAKRRWQAIKRSPTRYTRAKEQNKAAVARWKARHPLAQQRRLELSSAVRSGLITKQKTCQAAGCTKTTGLCGHHYDYSAPLDVGWFCHPHHRAIHRLGKIALKPGVPSYLGTAPDASTYKLPEADQQQERAYA